MPERDIFDRACPADGVLKMSDMTRDAIDARLLGDWQRSLPLVPRPFTVVAQHLGVHEADVIARLERLNRAGAVARVGAVVRPNSVGASTLAAIAAPDFETSDFAAIIAQEPGVNHLYLRENVWNLWFVVTGPNRDHVTQTLARIERRTGLRVLDLELVQSYHIDLGFPLYHQGSKYQEPAERGARSTAFRLKADDPELIQALVNGLPLELRPFLKIATALGRTEASVIARVEQLLAAGVIRRIGVIVRHRALGWRSNAMVVWDVNPDSIDGAGATLAAIPGVNLCYRRRRFERDWPYNLYGMVHAKTRTNAFKIITVASEAARLTDCSRQILFSSRCFKQTGAMLTAPKEAA